MNNHMHVSDDAYSSLAAKLLNTSGSVPLHERFRALFTLKSLKTPRAIDIIAQGKCLVALVQLERAKAYEDG